MTELDPDVIEEMFRRLKAANPEPLTELESVNDYTLLVAVMLSAQMTDKGVNKATRALFAVVDSPEKMLDLGEDGLKEFVKSVNLYPTKARHIIAMSRILVEKFESRIPKTRADLESLPGVGRKTANVILNVVYGQAVMPVDTHLSRLAPRTGLSNAGTVRGIEEDLMKAIPEAYLRDAHHWLLLHGRYVCTAKKPQCVTCILSDLCPKHGVHDPNA